MNKKTNISWLELEKETDAKFDVPPPSRKKIRKHENLSSIPVGGLQPPDRPRKGLQKRNTANKGRDSVGQVMFHRGSFSSDGLGLSQN